jgi:hypothetical protein
VVVRQFHVPQPKRSRKKIIPEIATCSERGVALDVNQMADSSYNGKIYSLKLKNKLHKLCKPE